MSYAYLNQLAFYFQLVSKIYKIFFWVSSYFEIDYYFHLVSRFSIYISFNWYQKHTIFYFLLISRFTRHFKLVSRYFQLVSFIILKFMFTFNWYLKNVSIYQNKVFFIIKNGSKILIENKID